MQTLQDFGIALIHSLQTLSPGLDGVMEFLSFLGRVEFYLIFLPFIYWSVDRRIAVRTILVLILVNLTGLTFKVLLHQPRPYWISDVLALSEETSYGIPSSHASDSTGVWGYLALRFKRRWFWIAAAALIVLISLSRLYLGMHFPHDVVIGWLIGAAVIALFVRFEGRIGDWAKLQSAGVQIGTAFAVSAVILLFYHSILALLAGAPDPESWAAFAAAARTPTYAYTQAGALFGTLTGYALMSRSARFRSDGPWLKRIERYVLGLCGVLVIYYGLDMTFALFAPDESALGYFLRYVRYAAVTIWVAFLAPWIFLKLGLAEAEV
jgi:membrane-associated phospholipid phosphatase